MTFIVLVLVLGAGFVKVGVEFGEPDGGWTYIFNGDVAGVDLDGAWNHENGSDEWLNKLIWPMY